MPTPEWERWRGTVDERMNSHEDRLNDQCERIDTTDEKLSQLLTKLAVPLFLVGIAGPVIGAVIVWAITKGGQ